MMRGRSDETRVQATEDPTSILSVTRVERRRQAVPAPRREVEVEPASPPRTVVVEEWTGYWCEYYLG